MMKKDWNEGLNHIAPDIVEEYIHNLEKYEQRKSKKGIWLRFGAVAASFCIIIGALITIPMLYDEPPITPQPPNGTDGNVVLENDPTHSTEENIALENPPTPGTEGEGEVTYAPTVNIQLSVPAPQYYGRDVDVDIAGGPAVEINTEGISVTARLLEILPDTYTFYDDWYQTEFRLIKMETLTLLKGENMTETFYYIVPVKYMIDFTMFDKFVIVDMGQYGFDYSILYNKTKGCAEMLDIVLFGSKNVTFDYLNRDFMAFDENGNFEISLWDANDAWKSTTSYREEKFQSGYTIEQAEKDYRLDDGYRSVSLLDGVSGESADVLSHIKSFENGLFIPDGDGFKAQLSPEIQLRFRRYVGGYATNERGIIYADSVSYSQTRFTQEDLNRLPNLTSSLEYIITEFEKGSIVPPHISNHSEMENTVYGIFGWYAKTANGVVGIVRVEWCYMADNYDLFFDDAYYIIEYGSDECKPIDRDALLERLGECDSSFIYKGEYCETGVTLYEPIC